MLDITNYQGNTNQNYNEESPHTSQNGHYQKNLKTINAGEGAEKRETSYTADENVRWCGFYGEQYGGALKN